MAEKKAVITAIPGVFYRRPSPEEEQYVKEGQKVKKGETIGIVEVMKSFYEIKAEHDGILETFNVQDGDIVDAGQEVAVLK